MDGFAVRKALKKDMDYLVGMARKEGWNPGLHDEEAFYLADPDGFFIGELEGSPVGCISAVRYGDFAFAGFFVVEKELRGGCYGILLVQAALDYLKDCNVGLDGVVEQQEHYVRMGFVPAHRNMRFEGICSDGQASSALPDGIVPAEDVDFLTLSAYDRLHFPADRSAFLRYWISMPDSTSLAAVSEERIRGFGTIRKCTEGYKIGPLFADAPDIAEALFNALTAGKSGEKVYLDISEGNQAALELTTRHGMRFVFETTRMYSKERPSVREDEVYGITSFELG